MSKEIILMCRIVRCVCWCLAIFILITPFLESLEKDPVTFINHGAEFSFITQPSFDTDNVDVVDVKFDINSTQQLLLFLIFLFSPVLFLFILFHVERLFSNLQVGEYFSIKNNSRLRLIALATVSLVIIEPILTWVEFSLLSVNMPIQKPPFVNIEVNFPMLLLGLVFYVVTFMMDKAFKIEQENQLTI